MFRSRTSHLAEPRRGVILLVVLSLLVLFAVVGLAFVLYANSEADASRIYRESQVYNNVRPDESPTTLLNYALGQLVYGVNDQPSSSTMTVYSGMRGNEVARDMFGWNGDVPGSNIIPFNGTGRLHNIPAPSALSSSLTEDYTMVNYTYFPTDSFVRDPERVSSRTSPTQPMASYTGGFNPPYTYPDINHMYLAAVNSSGQVLIPSFHRPWLFNPGSNPTDAFNDTTNPNWTNTQGKYLTLRPRPQEMGTGFPYPADATGDVKNLIGAPGGMDSIWMDLDYPVKTATDGTKYKPLFAFLVMDMDGRINVNVHGNVRGTSNAHLSNQGWCRTEVNPRLLNLSTSSNYASQQAEWPNLYLGNGTVNGRYGADKLPGSTTANLPTGLPYLNVAHIYGQADLDGSNEGQAGSATAAVPQPGTMTSQGFPVFPPGYSNGASTEITSHPMFYSPMLWGSVANPNYVPVTGPITINGNSYTLPDDLRIPASDMKRISYTGGPPTDPATSTIGQLLPTNIADPRIRMLLTTDSWDVGRPGMTPWIYNRNDTTGNSYAIQSSTPSSPPTGSAISFPAVSNRSSAVPSATEFGAIDWRSALAGLPLPATSPAPFQQLPLPLPRIDLNRFLPPYPHMGSGTDPNSYSATPMTNATTPRFDDPSNQSSSTTALKQFVAASNARKQFAQDIYQRLLLATGTPDATTTNTYTAQRWLAQLAVNIVDFIDPDEISTAFYFGPSGGAAQTTANPNIPSESLPKYWVFGTELPRVAISEVFTEYQTPLDASQNPTNGNINVNVWVELYNPSSSSTGTSIQPMDSQPVSLYMPAVGSSPAYAPYRIMIGDTNQTANAGGLFTPPNTNDNVTGMPQAMRAQTADADFNANTPTVAGGGATTATSISPQTYFLLGPSNSDVRNTITTTALGGTALLQSANLAYTVAFTTPPGNWQTSGGGQTDDRTYGISVLLRRLAIPYLPYSNSPNSPTYNPYITVDYLTGIPLNDATYATNPSPPATYTSAYASVGKLQPLAANPGFSTPPTPPAANGQLALQTKPASNANGQTSTSHTLGSINVPDESTQQGYYDWLTHLDRALISPMELLNVSGYQPHQLTQMFITGTTTSPTKYTQLVPWTNQSTPGQSNRLYRFFEYVQAHDMIAGVSQFGRIPGKININTIWDPGIFQALCDPQPGNSSSFTSTDVSTIFTNLLTSRTPSGTPGAADNPFWGFCNAITPVGDTQYPSTTYPNGSGINNTILRNTTASSTTPLFLPPSLATTAHPYLQNELLTKIYNNITTRSNVFAVWITVGLFQVTDDSAKPVKLGAEIGAAQGQNIRHRMFALVDRSNLSIFDPSASSTTPQVTTTAAAVSTLNASTQIALTALSGTTASTLGNVAIPWTIQAGSVLIVDTGAFQETVVVEAVPGTPANTIQATFLKPHAAGVPIAIPGNPGPQPQFDVHNPLYLPVVPYATIME